MKRVTSDRDRLFQVAAACQEAIQGQYKRESGQGYGLDDYTEGRIVGAANLARRIMRLVSGDLTNQPSPSRPAGGWRRG